jgi:capsular polysaccharide biosynthesis protein
MHAQFDAYEYLDYLSGRWRIIVVSAVVAVLLALVISLVLPKRYTTTALILIEPPAGADLRSSTAISPVYLESLKSYERFAASDTLFAQAAAQFHLQDGNGSEPVESLKRRVLKVAKPRDTRILEITVTLPDASKAHALAQYLAEQTIALNQSLGREGDQALLDGAQKRLEAARVELEAARAAVQHSGERQPVEGLQTEIESMSELKAQMQRQLMEAKAEVAEWTDRQKSDRTGDAGAEASASQARASVLEQQNVALQRDIDKKSSLLAKRTEMQDALRAQLKTAQSNYDSVNVYSHDLQGTAGYRGERLRLIDPGVTPQRPSSPNVSLNLVVALMVALTMSLVYLSFMFSFQRQRSRGSPVPVDLRVKRSND